MISIELFMGLFNYVVSPCYPSYSIISNNDTTSYKFTACLVSFTVLRSFYFHYLKTNNNF